MTRMTPEKPESITRSSNHILLLFVHCVIIINIGMLLVIQKKPTLWQWASIKMKN